MQIMKTQLMYDLLSKTFYETHKNLFTDDIQMVREKHGQQALKAMVDSGLYADDDDNMYITGYGLSANIFEGMPSPVTESELREYFEYYMKDNEMWPLTRSLDELVAYTVNIALPVYVKAGLLTVT